MRLSRLLAPAEGVVASPGRTPARLVGWLIRRPARHTRRSHHRDRALLGAGALDSEPTTAAAAFAAHRREIRRDAHCRAAVAVGLAWLALYQLLVWATASTGFGWVVVEVVYLVPIVLAAGAAVRAALRVTGPVTVAWRWIAVSTVCWTFGEALWSLGRVTSGLAGQNTPGAGGGLAESAADGAFLLTYMALVPAVLAGFGHTRALWRARGVLDAALVALGAGATGWHLVTVAAPQSSDSQGLTFLTEYGYALCGLMVVITLLSVGLSGHRGLPCSMLLVAMAYGVGALADAGFAYQRLVGGHTATGWVDLGWQAQGVLLLLAGVLAVRHPDLEPPREPLDRDRVFGAVLVSGVLVAGLVALEQQRNGRVEVADLLVAGVVMGGLLVRQIVTTRDRTRLARALHHALREQERLAVTDPLTGLHNRRFLQALLGVEARRAVRGGAPVSLILIDLDRFARINDAYGPEAGDAVLVQVADRLRTAARRGDVLARYGGSEFACLLPSADEETALELAERFRQLLRREPITVGGGVTASVTGSLGVATVAPSPALDPVGEPARPGPAGGAHPAGESAATDRLLDVDRLVRDADRALEQAKDGGRDQIVVAGRAARAGWLDDHDLPTELVWLADRVDRVRGDREHSTAVARWCLLVGGYLALDHVELRQMVAAARLHDIGYFAVDPAILHKTEPLTDEEWATLCRHPEEGARLLRGVGAVPGMAELASLVAAHHERWDGLGYPEGLAGEAIPLGARIIAVCDSWAAMRVDRPYAPALPGAEARKELERSRDTQFDPIVVDAFLALLDQDLIDDPAPLL